MLTRKGRSDSIPFMNTSMMVSVRSPSCADTFYPAEPGRLRSMVAHFVAKPDIAALSAKALIAPHAGYLYSGSIAGSAYAAVSYKAQHIKRILLVGPSHYRVFQGIAVATCQAMRTPLGIVPLDLQSIQACVAQGRIHYRDSAFDREHSLEVHLPFIQHVFDKVTIIPLIVGEASDEEVASVLSELWGGEETLIIISSDLSHFYDYKTACEIDLKTSQMIEKLKKNLTGKHACGYRAVRGLLNKAITDDIRCTTQDLRNSGDTAGPKDRVVGYGSYTFEEAHATRLPDQYRQTLLHQARQVLKQENTTSLVKHNIQNLPLPLRAIRRVFVTLKIDSHLRGCIGTIHPVDPLLLGVINNTFQSMYSDPRFPQVTSEEAKHIDINISILSHFRPLTFDHESTLLQKLQPHRDGLLIIHHNKKALFLPAVWKDIPKPSLFLQQLKKKANLDDTKPLPLDTQVFHFTSESFGQTAAESLSLP